MEAPGLNTKFKDVATLIKNAEIIWAADKYTLTNNDTAVSLATSGFYRSVVRGEPFPEKNFENRPFQNQLDNSSPSFPGMVPAGKKWEILFYVHKKQQLHQS